MAHSYRPAPNRRPPRATLSLRKVAPPPRPADTLVSYEADVLEGLESFAMEELQRRFGAAIHLAPQETGSGKVPFRYRGDPARLLTCRSLVGIYRVLNFAVPRPKALLGHQHFTALREVVEAARALHPAGAFRTLRLSAAGAESAVLQRLTADLASQTGLIATEQDEQDLLLRLRRDSRRTGWEALVSLSPRPLASRPWRACNMPGAMNATLAYAMIQQTLSAHPATETVLNLCCGSGTLLIERAASATFSALIGCDTAPDALHCAVSNVESAGLGPHVRLESWDVTALPLPDASVDVLVADLPFGQQIGTHRENERLYPRLLAEAGRVARPGARLNLLTHEVRLLTETIAAQRSIWEPIDEIRVRAGGMTPRVFLLHRL